MTTKNRKASYATRIKPIRDYVRRYQEALKGYVDALPEDYSPPIWPAPLSVGRCVIWPCEDAAVVLIYANPSRDISVVVKDAPGMTVREFTARHPAAAFVDENGHEGPRFVVANEDLATTMRPFGGVSLVWPSGSGQEYRPRFQNALTIGWDAELPDARQEALNDFRKALTTINLAGSGARGLSSNTAESISAKRAEELASEFEALLKEAS